MFNWKLRLSFNWPLDFLVANILLQYNQLITVDLEILLSFLCQMQILLFASCPTENLLEVIESFGIIIGLKVNMAKSNEEGVLS